MVNRTYCRRGRRLRIECFQKCEAVFNLNCPLGPPELRENFGFSIAQVAKIGAALADDVGLLCVAWSEIHESY